MKFPKLTRKNTLKLCVLLLIAAVLGLVDQIERNIDLTELLPWHNYCSTSFPLEPLEANATYRYLIDMDRCSKPKIQLLAMIISAPGNTLKRNVIRQTYGSPMESSLTQGYFFILGTSGNITIQNQVQEESWQYQDIIQGDFYDSYYNLSLKGTYGMEWTLRECSHVKWVLKIDDDMIVNPYELNRYIEMYPNEDSCIHCRVFTGVEVIRDMSSKWYASTEEMSNDTYGPYCSGPAYLLSSKIIQRLLRAQRQDPDNVFKLEDYHFTGKLADKAHIGRISLNSKYVMGSLSQVDPSTLFTTNDGISDNHVMEESLKKWARMTQPG